MDDQCERVHVDDAGAGALYRFVGLMRFRGLTVIVKWVRVGQDSAMTMADQGVERPVWKNDQGGVGLVRNE